MACVHELKIHPKYFDSVVDGSKTFEVRKNDRDFHIGDTLVLRPYLPLTGYYSSHYVRVLVTYILNDSDYVKVGYVIMGIKRV